MLGEQIGELTGKTTGTRVLPGAIYSGSGVGSVGEGMSIQLRFAVTFQAGGDGPLARLNSVVGVGEFETDAEGNVTARIWEWK